MSEVASTDDLVPTGDASTMLAARLAVKYRVLPLFDGAAGELVVAIADPTDAETLDELRLATGRRVIGRGATPTAIDEAIRRCYGLGADTLEQLTAHESFLVVRDEPEVAIDEKAIDASIVSFVNQLIVDAHRNRATDIHLEPFERHLRIRYRIDGVLSNAGVPPRVRHFGAAIVSRVKVMAGLDIAERRLPQDGKMRVRIGDNDFDLRVSVVPIAHGESVNMRVLSRGAISLGLEAIGFDEERLPVLESLLHLSHGLILVTGPTGSGKTTTLYASLNRINDIKCKIITIEDPVEYQIPGICQMQVKPSIGFSFANGLRSILRHDPDVILVGEIRDFETAELAVRSALTGHLVFSTLHTNDAAGAIPRLIDIGVEPYLLASSLKAVIAQRLVRMVCRYCAEADDSEPACELASKEGAVSPFVRGRGCDECRHTGYWGRTAIHELLLIDEVIRHLTMERAPGSQLGRAAIEAGMRTLREDGLRIARSGATTVLEVMRVTQEDGWIPS